MTKKIVVSIILITFILVIVVFSILLNKNANRPANEFNILDYQSFINDFPYEKTSNEIKTVEIAKKEAEKIWISVYGEKIKDNQPYIAYYDSSSKTWLITGSLQKNTTGGIPKIIIQSDGKVLALWHEK